MTRSRIALAARHVDHASHTGGDRSMLPPFTYRLQVSAEFPLDEVAGLADYVSRLGADWLYPSPSCRRRALDARL